MNDNTATPRPSAARRPKAAAAVAPRRWLCRVSGGGRVVIPAELRQELGLKQGDAVVLEATGGSIVLTSQREAIRTLQKKYRKVWQGEEFSSESFLAERKAIWGEE